MEIRHLKRSLTGSMKSEYYEYKSLFMIFLYILVGMIGGGIFLRSIGIFSPGFNGLVTELEIVNQAIFTAIVTMGISSISMTSKRYLQQRFQFPLNKLIFLISAMVMILFASFILISMTAGLSTIVLLLNRIVSLFSSSFIVISTFELKTYLWGLVFGFLNIINAAALIFCVFLFIKKWMIPSLIALALVIFYPVFNSSFLEFWPWIIKKIYFHDSAALTIVKFFLTYFAIFALSYIPLRKMEV